MTTNRSDAAGARGETDSPAGRSAGPPTGSPCAPAIGAATDAATGAATGAPAGSLGGAVARRTPIERCVGDELRRHFDLLGDEAPKELYRLVMQQAESSLLRTVMDACGGNQSKAASWLGISRGTLRGRLEKLDER